MLTDMEVISLHEKNCNSEEKITEGETQNRPKQDYLCYEETEESYLITGNNFVFVVNKGTGLFSMGSCKGEKLIESGPYLNFKGLYYNCLLYTSRCV